MKDNVGNGGKAMYRVRLTVQTNEHLSFNELAAHAGHVNYGRVNCCFLNCRPGDHLPATGLSGQLLRFVCATGYGNPLSWPKRLGQSAHKSKMSYTWKCYWVETGEAADGADIEALGRVKRIAYRACGYHWSWAG